MSPVTAALCASEPFPPNFPSSMYFFALSHAPPPAVIDIATNKPVIITPNNIAPTADSAASMPPIIKIIKYKIMGDKTGNKEGIIISLIAALVNKSTNLP